MKNFLTFGVAAVIFFFSAVSPSFALLSPGLSYLSNDQVFSDVLPQGRTGLSAKIEYWSAYDIWWLNSNPVMEPSTKFVHSFTIWSIPLRVSYGLTNDISLRFSTHYYQSSWVSRTFIPQVQEGYGLGDSQIEMLFRIAGETKENPSIGVTLGSDVLTGKSYKDTSSNELPTGLWAPNYYVSGIFGKGFGPWDGKAMLGFIFPGADKEGSSIYTPATEIICSVCMSTRTANGLEFGGEISGLFAGEANYDVPGDSDPTEEELSPISRISISPFVEFRQSDDLSWKAVLDIPLAMKATDSFADLNVHQYRGMNISIGADWTI